MRKLQFRNSLLATVILLSTFSCTKENDEAGNTDTTNASAQIIASENLFIPATVTVPPPGINSTNVRVATYYADGVQKYKAGIKAGTINTYEWVFVSPDAILYDITDAKVGSHGAGPFWQVSVSDSIFAQQFSPVRSIPSPDVQSIDWLLLKPKTGSTATGIFADVDYIQRIATKGGKAPSNLPVNATDTVSVKYTAIYRFTKTVL